MSVKQNAKRSDESCTHSWPFSQQIRWHCICMEDIVSYLAYKDTILLMGQRALCMRTSNNLVIRPMRETANEVNKYLHRLDRMLSGHDTLWQTEIIFSNHRITYNYSACASKTEHSIACVQIQRYSWPGHELGMCWAVTIRRYAKSAEERSLSRILYDYGISEHIKKKSPIILQRSESKSCVIEDAFAMRKRLLHILTKRRYQNQADDVDARSAVQLSANPWHRLMQWRFKEHNEYKFPIQRAYRHKHSVPTACGDNCMPASVLSIIRRSWRKVCKDCEDFVTS